MNTALPNAAKTEALLPNGENLSVLSPELSSFMDDLREKVKAARAWPVAGTFPRGYNPSFSPFQRLPCEVRQNIFAIACCQPRVVEVIVREIPVSETPVPAVLHACSESRKVAIKIYKPLILHSIPTKTFVNWMIDTIFINDRRGAWTKTFDLSDLYQNCRKLALTGPRFNFHPAYQNVECLIVVLRVQEGEGGVKFVPADSVEDAAGGVRQKLMSLWETKRIKTFLIRDAVRGRDRTISNSREKILAQQRREKERESIEPVRSDEDLAIRVQFDLDHGRRA